ncbi:hypothetical protein [Haloarcula sp. JP-L23]|uniref:hypothetical protein n=1 Tax=Haloarcula sp. JP-L23 TaxID=2716717 RepID=UPI00140F3FF2|nr:hypothetical protein G9465_24720 [Haloarcula sp. JP-L23]
MSDHRHDTDQSTTVVVGACPNGCQSFEMESDGPEKTADAFVERVKATFPECSDCGSDMGFVRKDEPSEVLE